jgi:hypothetical protein
MVSMLTFLHDVIVVRSIQISDVTSFGEGSLQGICVVHVHEEYKLFVGRLPPVYQL